MNKGFKRLKGVAAASAMGLGLLGGAGSVRAATVSTRRSGITVQRNGVTFGVQWNRFRNTSISGGVGLRFSGTSVFATLDLILQRHLEQVVLRLAAKLDLASLMQNW